jgi:hypothetical protein
MDAIRKPLLIIAIVAALLVVLLETGSAAKVGVQGDASAQFEGAQPGKGIPYLALLDSLVLYTALLLGAALVLPEAIQGRLQGIVSLLVGIVALIGSILLALGAFELLTLMLSMLVAVPFGTLAYLAAFGNFDKQSAAIALSMIMTCKFVFVGCLVFAHQRFLQNKGLVIIIFCSLLVNLLLAFLHGFVPGFLVSITDTIGALIIAILAAIWALVFLLGSISSVVKAIV